MSAGLVLLDAADYIERGWCRGEAATTATGEMCMAHSPQAVAWCAIGAVDAACCDRFGRAMRDYPEDDPGWDEHHKVYMSALGALTEYLELETTGDLGEWNDAQGTTQARVAGVMREVGRMLL